MFRNIEALTNQIRIKGLDLIADKIITLAKPAVQMKRTPAMGLVLPSGASKLGGDPDVPKNFRWPHWKDKPLTFITQFKLSEVPAALPEEPDPDAPRQLTLWDLSTIPTTPMKHNQSMLPEQGILYFFYDVDELPFDESDGWRVYYVEDENTPLERISHPTHEGKWWPIRALPQHTLHFYRTLSVCSLADMDRSDRDFLFGVFEEKDRDAYEEKYWDMLYENYPNPRHYLYGYAMPIQGSVEEYCASSAIQLQRDGFEDLSHEHNWQFLFQIDSDNSLGVMWVDAGTVYVCIPKHSLAKRRFEDCWVIMQFH